MTAVTFDTFKYIKTLENAGVPRQQAEAQVAAQQESLAEALEAQAKNTVSKEETISFKSELKADISSLRSELKADASSLRSELKADASSLRAEFKADLREVELRIIIKMGAMLAASIGAIVTLIKLL